MVACFRQGYVVLPCTEQLRAKDLRLRLEVAAPALVVVRRAQRATTLRGGRLDRADACCGAVGRSWPERTPPPHAELDPEDPCLITFTSGTAGEPKAVVHAQRYLAGQRAAGRALARRPPRRARVVHGRQRLDQVGAQRLHRALAARRGRAAARRALRPRRAPGDPRRASASTVLCMAPTEYRVIAKRAEPRPIADAARPRRRRRGAQPRGPARLARGHRPVDPRRLRPDRDRADHRACRSAARRVPGLDGPPAAGHRRLGRRRRARARPGHGARPSSAATSATRRRRRPVAHRRPRHARTTTASCSSRAAPTT